MRCVQRALLRRMGLLALAAVACQATLHQNARNRTEFCDAYNTTCGFGGSNRYADEADCLASFDLAQYTEQQCYKYHLTVAEISASEATIHCPHAAGASPCTLSESFCWFYEQECGFDGSNAERWDSSSACQSGWDAATGSQRECMHYHLLAAEATSNAVHCGHAAQQAVCGEGSGTFCDTYGGDRSLAPNHAPSGCEFSAADGSKYDDTAACSAKWDSADQKGSFASPIVTKDAGNVTQRDCIEYHLFAAWTTKQPEIHCPHATGADPCDDGKIFTTAAPTTAPTTTTAVVPTTTPLGIHQNQRTREEFCTAWNATCGYGAGSGKYVSEADCLSRFDGAQYVEQQCYKYHLTVAEISSEMATIHCPHATGLSPCTLSESFCWFYGQECGFDGGNVDRWDNDPACQAGWDAAAGSQRECMHYHLLAAEALGPAHCAHAAQQVVCGEGSGTFCDTYAGDRSLAPKHSPSGCTFSSGDPFAYDDVTACSAKWDAADVEGDFASPIVAGSATQRDCIEYHLFAAWITKQPDIHCPHATGADPCNDERIATTTMAPTTTLQTTAVGGIHQDARTREEFCAEWNSTCGYGAGSGKYADEADCLARFDTAQYVEQQCYKYHLNVAQSSAENAVIHCPHATGLSPCTLGESFCFFYEQECGFDGSNADRWDSSSACNAGWDSASGSQRECMHYHLLAAEALDHVHCAHAAQQVVCGEGSGTFCDAYAGDRSLAPKHAPSGCVFSAADASAYDDVSACTAKWDAADVNGEFDSPIVSGAATQRDCIEYHLFAAWITKQPEIHCPHATGADPCNDERIVAPTTTVPTTTPVPIHQDPRTREEFCAEWNTTCGYGTGVGKYSSESDCLSRFDGAQYVEQQCYKYHLNVAQSSPENSVIHCPHAAGQSPCTLSESFCWFYEQECGFDDTNTDRWDSSSACAAGWDAATGSQRECMHYHLLAAEALGPAHCAHAAQQVVCGEGSGTFCDAYAGDRSLAPKHAASGCTFSAGDPFAYDDVSACTAKWDSSNVGGEFDSPIVSGSATQRDCIEYHLFAAWITKQPDIHCPHATGADPCNDERIITTTMAPTSPGIHQDGRTREEFCAEWNTTCGYGAGVGKYSSEADCLMRFDTAQYVEQQCYKYHLNVAQLSPENSVIHCPHAAGQSPCSLGESFCFFYEQECGFDNANPDRWDSSSACNAGWNAATGSQRECMHYHLLAAEAAGPVHCAHAAQQVVCGEGSGTFCDAYAGDRSLAPKHAPSGCAFSGSDPFAYDDVAECSSKWDSADVAGEFDSPIVSGSATQRDCIEYHLFAAWITKQPDIHCPHATGADPCNDERIAPTTTVTTVSAASTTPAPPGIHQDGRTREEFCTEWGATCGFGAGSGKYADQADCLARFDQAQYVEQQCYKYHLNVAQLTAENEPIHCPHAAGQAPCTLSESFCWFYEQECGFDAANSDRWNNYGACTAGWDAAAGSQRECMHYHLLAAEELGPVHCAHAAQQVVCGEGSGTFCDAYGGDRSLAPKHAPTGCSFSNSDGSKYDDSATCAAKWTSADQAGNFDSPIITGDATQRDCIEYHLFAAWITKQPDVHCPHATGADPCNDERIATTTSAPVTTLPWRTGVNHDTPISCNEIVEWQWADGLPHTVTPDAPDDDFGWRWTGNSVSGNGEVLFSVQFSKNGVFTYFCAIHTAASMAGTVTVTGCPAPTTTTTAAPVPTSTPMSTPVSTVLQWRTGVNIQTSISCGERVQWQWADGLPHTVTPDNPDDDFQWRWNGNSVSGNGQILFSVIFTKNGAFSYFCAIHTAASMKGTVTVTGCPAEATTTTASAVATTSSTGTAGPTSTPVITTTPVPTTSMPPTTTPVSTILDWRIGSDHTTSVSCGERVAWRWGDSLPHTVTPGTPDNSFGWVWEGASVSGNNQVLFAVTFTKNGQFSYICAVHGAASMKGTVTVTGCPASSSSSAVSSTTDDDPFGAASQHSVVTGAFVAFPAVAALLAV